MSLFPPSCRIVVVSSSRDTSEILSRRIKAYAGDQDNDTSTPTGSPQQAGQFIPWNITNKYYTAQVHFHPVDTPELEFLDWEDVPAVVFTWREGESFKEHLKKIATLTSSYSPEVSLAISLEASEDLESLCFEHGFEYVHSAGNAGSDDPGLHRAVDALSTIMWPTMQRVDSGKTAATNSHSQLAFARDLFTSNYESENILNDLVKDFETSAPTSAGAKTRIQMEMEAFERWLDDVVPSPTPLRKSQVLEPQEDAWKVGSSPAPGTNAGTSRQTTDETSRGFDDDFTDFISAPSIDVPRDGRRNEGSTPTRDSNAASDDASDEDLPNHDDILKTSARIFGAPRGTHDESRPPLSSASRSQVEDEGYVDLGEEDHDSLTKLDRDAYSGSDFDLSHVFSTLQLLKEEISGMEDESERRKAAARVALGLVYGLDRQSDDIDSDSV